MKKKILVILCLLSLHISVVVAQFRKVPAEVTEAFKIKYPSATEVSWSDKITAFQASFILNDEKLEADFNSKGIWKKTTRNLELADLPEAINLSFKESKYNTDWTIKSVLETQKEDATYEYRLLVEKSALQKKYLYFSKQGKLLREAIAL